MNLCSDILPVHPLECSQPLLVDHTEHIGEFFMIHETPEPGINGITEGLEHCSRAPREMTCLTHRPKHNHMANHMWALHRWPGVGRSAHDAFVICILSLISGFNYQILSDYRVTLYIMYEQYIRETTKWDAGPWRVSRRETAMIVIIVNF